MHEIQGVKFGHSVKSIQCFLFVKIIDKKPHPFLRIYADFLCKMFDFSEGNPNAGTLKIRMIEAVSLGI